MIDLVSVLQPGTVDLGRHPAGVDEWGRFDRQVTRVRRRLDLGRGLARHASFAAGHHEATLVLEPAEAFFEGAADGGGDSRTVPRTAPNA
jgi:hypothetical protein